LVAAVADWAPVDILVNNAGMQKTVTLEEADRGVWDAVIALNLSACFHTMRLTLPGMGARGYGRVINIASVHGLVASVAKAPYVSSKFGLVGLTKVAALEYAAAGSRESGGVTVNAICPGWVETALIEPQIQARAEKAGGDRAAGVRDLVSEKEPSLRMADPSDIGALALFLCSPAAHNMTGTALPVDGGWTAQ
jgi:3-hydroxybutyrate dehydrogenase